MSDQANIESAKRVSKIWFIPIITLALGVWMVYHQWKNQGPEITIELLSAEGIEVNKTPIKIRDLEIGKVKDIKLNQTLDGVVITAQIEANAANLMTQNAEFWVVSPRISFSEVSGLGTLLSGSYIAMSSNGQGREQYEFTALERPPVTPAGTPGLHLTLTSDAAFAYKAGDPIIYKGFKVGEFEDANFNVEDRIIYYTAFIEAPYHQLITQNTRFWNVSGVKFSLASSGVEVEAGSLETLLANGVTFGIPDGVTSGEKVTENAFFDIFNNEKAASDARFKLAVEYLLLIEDSVRGLEVGAPVEYRGLQIGEVVAINTLQDIPGTILDEGYPIPVIVNVYPGKVHMPDTQEGVNFVRERMRGWLSRDLRATLKMGNLLTGGLYVDLQHYPSVAKRQKIQTIFDYDVIPVMSSEFTQLTQKAEAILDKINELPLEKLVVDMTDVIETLGTAASSVTETSDNFDLLIADMDGESINTNVNNALEQLTLLLEQYANGGLNPEEIQQTVQQMQDTLRALQPVLMQLNQTPNSLIFSDNSGIDIEPKAKSKGVFDE